MGCARFQVRCWTPIGQTEQGRFALDTAIKTLSFFGDYFDSPYPLPKMDMIAIPDFSAGNAYFAGLSVDMQGIDKSA